MCQAIGSLPSLNVVRSRVPSPIALVDSLIQLGLRILPANCRCTVLMDRSFFDFLTRVVS